MVMIDIYRCKLQYNMMFIYLAILSIIVMLPQRIYAFSIGSLQDIDERYKKIVFQINKQQKLWMSRHSHQELNLTLKQKPGAIDVVQNITQQEINDRNAAMKQNNSQQVNNQSSYKLPSNFQFKKKYQTFIYPYEVYLIEDQSHQFLEQYFINFMSKIQDHFAEFHLGINNTQHYTAKSNISIKIEQKQTSDESEWQNRTENANMNREEAQRWERSHLNPPPFLMFVKVSKCLNENSCKLLKHLPKNIVFTPTQRNQYLKIHKISQSDFIIESILRSSNIQSLINQQEVANISNSNETSENKSIKSSETMTNESTNDKNKGYSSNIWLYNVNINNHIFYKMNGKESLIRRYDRLMVGHKVIEIEKQNQSWDIAYNGSAFRLIKHKKQLFTQYLQRNRSNIIEIKNGHNDVLIPKFNNSIPIIREKIHIPTKLKLPVLNANPEIKSQKQLVQYANTFQVVQYGINQNFQNKPYQIIFFTQEYQNPSINLFEGYPSLDPNNQVRKYQMVSSLDISFRRSFIGSDKNGNFHLHYHQYQNQREKLTKIFKSTLKQLSLIEQIKHTSPACKIATDNSDYKIEWGNINLVSIGYTKMCNKNREYLIYLQQKSNYTFDKKKLEINQMHQWNNQSKFARTRNQNYFLLIIKQIKSINPYSNSFSNILTARAEEKELSCEIRIGNESTIRQAQHMFISKLNEQYLVICSQWGYQNDTEHDLICRILNTECEQIYSFTIYISEYMEMVSDMANQYQLRWQLKQCTLYEYQTQISVKISSKWSNTTRKHEQQQTYIKLYIDRDKMQEYLIQSSMSSQQNNTRAQQNITIIYILQDLNTIHQSILKNKSLNQTVNQTYLSFINSYDLNMEVFQFNHSDFNFNESVSVSNQLSNSQENNTNITDHPLYSQLLKTQWESNLFNEININEPQLQIFQNTYFRYEDYKNRTKFRYLYGSQLMESKLNPIFHLFLGHDAEPTEVQESNCRLQWDQRKLIDVEAYQNQISSEGYRVRKLIGIKFKNQSQQKNTTSVNEWQICRLSIDTGHENLVISPEIAESEIKKPYKVFRCSLQNSSLTSKCYYNEQKIDKSLILHPNSKSILFIVNNGQVYNLSIQDLSSMEMDKITQSFVIMFICLLIVFLTFLSMFMCRRLCMLGRLYFGWVESEDEPRFRYPLNCIELKLKLKRMKKLGIIRQINQSKSFSQEMDQNELHIETDDCVFCLQQKQSEQKIMETYCKHSYHKECFSEWVKQQSTVLSCPMCKRKLNFQGLSRYLEEGGRSQVHIL